ncbi:MAG: hypothetical protein ABI707_13960 [Ferruginibacter sp.]
MIVTVFPIAAEVGENELNVGVWEKTTCENNTAKSNTEDFIVPGTLLKKKVKQLSTALLRADFITILDIYSFPEGKNALIKRILL